MADGALFHDGGRALRSRIRRESMRGVLYRRGVHIELVRWYGGPSGWAFETVAGILLAKTFTDWEVDVDGLARILPVSEWEVCEE